MRDGGAASSGVTDGPPAAPDDSTTRHEPSAQRPGSIIEAPESTGPVPEPTGPLQEQPIPAPTTPPAPNPGPTMSPAPIPDDHVHAAIPPHAPDLEMHDPPAPPSPAESTMPMIQVVEVVPKPPRKRTATYPSTTKPAPARRAASATKRLASAAKRPTKRARTKTHPVAQTASTTRRAEDDLQAPIDLSLCDGDTLLGSRAPAAAAHALSPVLPAHQQQNDGVPSPLAPLRDHAADMLDISIPEPHLDEVAAGPGHNGATVSSPPVAQPTGAGSFAPAVPIPPPTAMSPALFGALPVPRSRTTSDSVLIPPLPPVQPPPVQLPLASMPILGPTTSPVFVAYTLTQLASGRQALRPVPVRLQEVDPSSLGALSGLRAQASRLGLQTVVPLVTDAVGPESLSTDVLRAVGMTGPAVSAPGMGVADWRENGLRAPTARSGHCGRVDINGQVHGYEQAAHAAGQSPWAQSAARSAPHSLFSPMHSVVNGTPDAPTTSSLSLAMGPAFFQTAHEGHHHPVSRGPVVPYATANYAAYAGGSVDGHHDRHHQQFPGCLPELDQTEGPGLDRVLCPSIPASSLQSPWPDAPPPPPSHNQPIVDDSYGAASTIAPAVELHGYPSTDLGASAEHAYAFGGGRESWNTMHATTTTTTNSNPTLLPMSPLYGDRPIRAATTTIAAYATDTTAPSAGPAPADMAHLMEQYAQATGFAAPVSSAGTGSADTYAGTATTHSYHDAQYQSSGAADMDLDPAGGYYESPRQMDVPMPLAGLPMPLADHADDDAWREATARAAAVAVSAATRAENHPGNPYFACVNEGGYPSLQAAWAEIARGHDGMGGAESSAMSGATGIGAAKAVLDPGAGMWDNTGALQATMGGGGGALQPDWSRDEVHWADRPGPGL
ncbi:hypothetical protein AMAG_04140 [Allomyces macrogynus ATCC 38327]|uniref:Uncharacterized protein n=1 Tax=Allomyces macrogynus (strain ATCC 38327) TaxID=578462 RepID=A0A0L0S894_ALLM3|nr:hypothetical protein AMAG_04140 [Allomyces macrogynus ATCC 38327]|eukprot:KNE58574.1 hypothetical protein AMAG_04140 [Allomyces macrogynus ATCC 38327]